jgi:NADH:ubiquinone oxidoreductase subunit F (NADH-binding)
MEAKVMLERKIITKRCGLINPLSIQDYIQHGGYKIFEKALNMDKTSIIEEIESSRLRGRGGAGFATSVKLWALAKESSQTKYIICNADEGEPGNFKDRYLLENDPHQIIEGMLIAAYATRATKGIIYVRGEYHHIIDILNWTINQAKEQGYLGERILDHDFSFDIELRSGAGSYVCGEEFALIESIEGKPGRTRVKPPFPTQRGVYNQPTLINNVETFANFIPILEMGGKAYAKIGTQTSTGTKLISLSGNVNQRGVYEIEFGTRIIDVINQCGLGIPNHRKIKMVQISGASGPIIPEYMLDISIDFERFEEFDSRTGAGAIIVIDDRFDMFDILDKTVDFFEHESCGKCTPCREGHRQLSLLIKKFKHREAEMKDLVSIESLARVIHQTSLCGLGQASPTAIISTLQYFREDYLNCLEHRTLRQEAS